MATYPGIDYSGTGATCNRDATNGIRYGVISTGSLTECFWDSVENDYGEATCPKCGNPAEEGCIDDEPDYPDWTDHGSDYFCRDCHYSFNSENAFPEEALGWSIDDGEYKVIDCLDTDAMIILAPYYTYAQFCSPCVPGAGNLDTPMAEGVKCYCFGHSWFDGEQAPYPVFRVDTGEEVQS